uniref:Mediator of RNA polymerase II transcription subunit 7 n=1 Tax=Arcella intermedia TaxID=1963864 RepID=A0A6B2LHL6_9EUKA
MEKEVAFLYAKEGLKPGEELKKLNLSLLFNFLELVENIKYPDQCEDIIKNKITPIFKNMHHLLNLYRPHQTRQVVIALLEQQIERRKTFLKSIETRLERSEKTLLKAKRTIYMANSAANQGTKPGHILPATTPIPVTSPSHISSPPPEPNLLFSPSQDTQTLSPSHSIPSHPEVTGMEISQDYQQN